MQPFAQDQTKSSGRAWMIIAILAIAFSVWFFDVIPRLQPVESGRLVQQTNDDSDIPALPESWDEIVDHTGDADATADNSSEYGASNPLLAAIAESVESDLPNLVEPDVFDAVALSEPGTEPIPDEATELIHEPTPDSFSDSESEGHAEPPGESAIQTASFVPAPAAMDQGVPSESNVVTALSTQAKHSEPAHPKPQSAPPVLPADAAAEIREADELLAEDKIVQAHGKLSKLYWQQPEQRSVIQRRINFTAAQIFTDQHRHFSQPYLVLPGDTFESIAQHYEVPWTYLSQLNRIDPQSLQAGQEIKVMRGPFHAVVDLRRFELTVHAHGYYVHRYDIGTGRNASTPTGDFTVQEKLENPTWYNPDGGTVDGNDPDNPLGEYWIGLGEHIGIHGTIDPESIGRQRSRGCIHMRDRDIAEVFSLLGEDSQVRIRE